MPGPKSRKMAQYIFGEDVEFVRGGKSTNYKGVTDGNNHAEARGIQYMLDNDISTEGARQSVSHYSCIDCEAKQEKHDIINITGNASDNNGIISRGYVNNLYTLKDGGEKWKNLNIKAPNGI